jgi:hypothetical protein
MTGREKKGEREMNEVDPRYGDVSWYHEGRRCQELDSRRCGTLIADQSGHVFWGGYVPVEWDNGRRERVHIRDIRQILTPRRTVSDRYADGTPVEPVVAAALNDEWLNGLYPSTINEES